MSSQPQRTLLVASTGGHLEQLSRLRRGFVPESSSTEWVTFADQQSVSLLANERVTYVPYIQPRGYLGVLRSIPTAVTLLRSGRFDRVVSTGAGIALAFLPVARLLGVRAHYIESSARASGPSVTGRILSFIPGVRLYSQYRSWETARWHYCGSLFDAYEAASVKPDSDIQAQRIVVTLGTMRRYGFRRAVERILEVLPEVATEDAEILWQVGASEVSDLPIHGRTTVPASELVAAVRSADLVIAHAGIGSCLTALDAGKSPVLLPREAAHGEHVDDHQQMIARELDRRGLAISRSPDGLRADDLREAMRRSIIRVDSNPFRLMS